MLIDIHCHLTGGEFEEVGGVAAVIERAKEAGVERMICSGYDYQSSLVAKSLSETYPEVYFCAGFHPSEIESYEKGDMERLSKLCRHEKCVAVGEIGLDYHFENNPPKEKQKKFFIRQLELAHELGLPVVLHSRDALGDTLEVLRAHASLLENRGLMHCYSYSAEMVMDFLLLGMSFSFGGPATFKNARKVQESVQKVPETRILAETDCPYLTPTPFRGVFPNEPKNVRYVVDTMVALREESKEDLERQLVRNARALFPKLK